MKKSTKEIIFAVPGSKVFISKYYNNRPNSFLNISLTGKKCELMCRHCKARLLSDMVDINSTDFVNPTDFILPDVSKPKENRVMEIILRYQNNCVEPSAETSTGDKTRNRDRDRGRGTQTSVNGILISGGFDRHGRLPMDERLIPELKEVKNKYGLVMKVFVHLGFTDRQTAESLYECGIDGVLVNVFSDKHSIEETYNLKGCIPDMFYGNARLLKEAGLRVSPHLIIGLGESSLSGEYRSVEEIAKSGADSCVFAIAKNISRHDKHGLTEVKSPDVVKLFKYAKSIMPDIPVILGCARPHGQEFEKMEIELLKLGVNVIAFPSGRTLEYAKDNNYSFHFEEQCCAFLADQ
jgi:lipoyl synthase